MDVEVIDGDMNEHRKMYMKEGNLSDHEINLKLQELRMHLENSFAKLKLREKSVKGSPLLDVLSVTILPKSNNSQPPWQIYGTILATFGTNSATYDLFRQPFHDPQIISSLDSNGTAFLNIFGNGPFYGFFPLVKFRVDLIDKVRNMVLVHGRFQLDYSDFSEFDKIQYKEVESDVATVCFRYVTRRAALNAAVDVALVNNNGGGQVGDGGENMTVTGTVFASCQNDASDSERGCCCVPLFARSHDDDEGVEISVGESMELMKCTLAVPVYSTLVIELNLMSAAGGGGDVVKDAVEFCPLDIWWRRRHQEKTVEGSNGSLFQVQVEWYHEYVRRMEVMEEEEEVDSFEESEDESDEDIVEDGDFESDDYLFQEGDHEIIAELIDDLFQGTEEDGPNHENGCIDHHNKVCETQALVNVPLYDHTLDRRFIEEYLIEIFSIFVGADDDHTYDIYGKIEVDDFMGEFIIYDKDQSHIEKFACGKTLPLQGSDRFFVGSEFSLKLDLKDNNGHEFCKGWFDWSVSNLKAPWQNARLCSVIKGEIGFVAVHYSLFTHAVRCKVKAFLSPISPCDHISINGTVIGEYSNHDYSTLFERELYRIVLFKRCNSEAMILPLQGEEIPTQISSYVKPGAICMPISLSKSMVCVPTNSGLRIKLNLLVSSQSPNIGTQSLSDTLEFHIGRDTCWRIQSQDFHIYMLAEWGRVN